MQEYKKYLINHFTKKYNLTIEEVEIVVDESYEKQVKFHQSNKNLKIKFNKS